MKDVACPDEFRLVLEVAKSAANCASSILQHHFAAGVDANEKATGDQSEGLVTVADVEAENAIIETIKSSFPDHSFLAEESAASGDNPDHLWVIDPLDGTNNFAFGIPQFATSIAYWKSGQPAVGVVLDPMRDECFVAVQGHGATLNDEPISVNQHVLISHSMIATGFYYDRGEIMQKTLRCIDSIFRQDVKGVRRMGAASLDLAWVACGRYGAFFELTLSPWDYAAARLMVTESGGEFTDCEGQEIGLEASSVLASNGQLHLQMLDSIRPHMENAD